MDTGTRYETKFRAQLKTLMKKNNQKYFTYKNPDFRSTQNNNKALPDRLVIIKGRSYLIEIKHTNNKVSFPLANIPAHQIGFLLKHKHDGGGQSYVAIYNPDNEKGLFIDIDNFVALIDATERKSIKFTELVKVNKILTEMFI